MNRAPFWPSVLEDFERRLPNLQGNDFGGNSAEFRKSCGLGEWRDRFSKEVVLEQVGVAKLDTLICDGFLPLLAARN